MLLRSLSLCLCVSVAVWAGADPQRYMKDVRELASPTMKGRGDGTPELEQAARYIAKQFQAAGLEPLNGKSYLQPFTLSVGALMGPGNVFRVGANGKSESLRAGEDFVPLSFSSRSDVEGQVDRKSTRLNSSHIQKSRMPSSA